MEHGVLNPFGGSDVKKSDSELIGGRDEAIRS